MPYRSEPIETLVAEGMTGYLAKLLEAGERPLRSPKTGANEPISERPTRLEPRGEAEIPIPTQRVNEGGGSGKSLGQARGGRGG